MGKMAKTRGNITPEELEIVGAYRAAFDKSRAEARLITVCSLEHSCSAMRPYVHHIRRGENGILDGGGPCICSLERGHVGMCRCWCGHRFDQGMMPSCSFQSEDELDDSKISPKGR